MHLSPKSAPLPTKVQLWAGRASLRRLIRLPLALALMILAVVLTGSAVADDGAGKIGFNRDIRPILAEACFACHGPDSASRQADLRLDDRESAVEQGALTPGEPDASELIRRILSDDPDEAMPPPEMKKSLTDEQKQLLVAWVAEGAEYQQHWAFLPPNSAEPPQLKDPAWAKNPIDQFIGKRLEEEGLAPAEEADRRTLARRVSLDLTGLPPDSELLEEYLSDTAEGAYERLVEKLLALPAWGEHRGRYWLDYARYGDTHGIHIDNYREMWSYRDWVIKAFNANMPFDQFTVESIAGDLLPNATLDQQTASGFNRCNITTSEGGAIPEEYAVLYARDRTETTSQVWMGLTVGCAVCHDHKFDPISQRDFYQLSAFFNNTTQSPMDGNIKDTPPVVTSPLRADRENWRRLEKEIAGLQQAIGNYQQAAPEAFAKWLVEVSPESIQQDVPTKHLHVSAPLNAEGPQLQFQVEGETKSVETSASVHWQAGPLTAKAALLTNGSVVELPEAGDFEKDQAFSCSAWVRLSDKVTDGAIVARMDESLGHRGWDMSLLGGNRLAMHVVHLWPQDAIKVAAKEPIPTGVWTHVAATYDGSGKSSGMRLFINGVETAVDTQNVEVKETVRVETPLHVGQRSGGMKLGGVALQDVRVYKVHLDRGEVDSLANAGLLASKLPDRLDELSEAERTRIHRWWLSHHNSDYMALEARLAVLEQQRKDISSRATIAYVMQERNEAPHAYVLDRGEYDQRKEKVDAGTPDWLPAFPTDQPANRLGLARWLVSPEHPLTTRVTVNRCWQEVFGTGLVATAGDFGVAGQIPSHPDLLDWLALEFRDSGWDVKQLFRLIVTSAAYRQSAVVTAEKFEQDPQNRLLARGPRFRMDAEMVRDTALKASGLLSSKIGGPSVKPYQPDGVWEAVAMQESNTRFYKRDAGESLYRRSMYTFWKRSAPPASMETFNAPSRENCTITRERTNTPLQALCTLNDVQMIEAARNLAQQALGSSSDGGNRQCLDFMTLRVLGRLFDDTEAAIALESYEELLQEFKAHPEGAAKLIATGETATDASLDTVDLAAWTMLANEILNLDETLNK